MRFLNKLSSWSRARAVAYGSKRYHSPDPGAASYSLLSAAPPIFYVAHWMDENFVFMSSLDMLFDYLRDRRAYFLYAWYWWIEDPRKIRVVRSFEQAHRRKYPGHRFIHLCNTVRQFELFREQGLDAIFCNHNCLVDERIFRPVTGIAKEFDAVYDARLKPYKRHYLAAQIANLGLIYDLTPHVDDPKVVVQTRQAFPSAHFINHDQSDAYRRLSPDEVNIILNKSRVGLCLSGVEGAMYASMQYLLSGLPVVSTKSVGGRDVFFDAESALIVDSTPEAVAAGVNEIVRRDIAASEIRRRALEKIMVQRQTLITRVQAIYDQENAGRDFTAEWDDIFFDKLLNYQSHAKTIERLVAAGVK